MSARVWAIATVVTGAATLGLFVVFSLLPDVQAAGACMARGAVVQFELARHVSDLIAIFGEPDSACRPLAISAMDAVNRLDMAVFIPVYTLFCIAAALFLADGNWRRPLVIVAIGAALVAAAADYLETTTLLAITQAIDTPGQLLQYSQLGAWSKFAMIAAHAVFCAGICYTNDKQRLILGTILMLPPFGVAAAAYDQAGLLNIMNATLGLAWLSLLVMAIVSVVRAKAAQA